MVSRDETSTELAQSLRKDGNGLFNSGRFLEAVQKYTEALDVLEEAFGDDAEKLRMSDASVYLSNRSICNIRMENFGSAVLDANRCIELQPTFPKGYYRRGCANLAVGKLSLALRDFQNVIRLQPNDPLMKKRVKEVETLIRQKKFFEAIATDKTAAPSETIQLDPTTIPKGYAGPSFPLQELIPDQFLGQLVEHHKSQQLIPTCYAYDIILRAIGIFKPQPSLVEIEIPEGSSLAVCGDVHGQFYDLANIFKMNDLPSPSNRYLFNGDFVDRGNYSLECIITLLAAKVMYPESIYLSRGNHEVSSINRIYGFLGECKAKYCEKMYDVLSECFQHLPLAHVIKSPREKIFCVHGGLPGSNDIALEDIRKIDRVCEPSDDSLVAELLWSDPMEAWGRAPSKRGIACQFGPDITEGFCNMNDLKMVIRSHEMKENGYEIQHNNRLITVFSAPNYCDTMGNKGAFITVRNVDGYLDTSNISTFTQAPHPPSAPLKYVNPIMGCLM